VSWQKVVTDAGVVTTSIPKPGTKWRPLHQTPHQNNKTITIRRFIAGERKKP
jgi:hypothetical protein